MLYAGKKDSYQNEKFMRGCRFLEAELQDMDRILSGRYVSCLSIVLLVSVYHTRSSNVIECIKLRGKMVFVQSAADFLMCVCVGLRMKLSALNCEEKWFLCNQLLTS